MKYRQHATLAFFTFALAFVVILLGAFTRLTDAGLSCPDWPNCFGYITAPHTESQITEAAKLYPQTPVNPGKAWTEMVHRYFAGTEGILILILSFTLLFSRHMKGFKPRFISLALMALLILQVMLGMLTVTEKLKPVIVLGHLLTGLSLLSLLWWAYLDLYIRKDFFVPARRPWFAPWVWLGFILLVLQITLGGWVSTHYAGLACIDFPYCNGTLLPTMHWQQWDSDLVTIHMLHRIGAAVTATYLGVLALLLLATAHFRWAGFFLLCILLSQIGLGIVNILWLRPVGIALLHQMVAILLLLTLITILVKSHFETWKTHHGSWAQ